MDKECDHTEEDVHEDKQPDDADEFAKDIACVGKRPGKDNLVGIRSPVPFEEFRGHKNHDNPLKDIEELEAEKRDGSRKGPEVVWESKRRGCDPGRQQAQNNKAQQGEYAETPGPQENFGLIKGNF